MVYIRYITFKPFPILLEYPTAYVRIKSKLMVKEGCSNGPGAVSRRNPTTLAQGDRILL